LSGGRAVDKHTDGRSREAGTGIRTARMWIAGTTRRRGLSDAVALINALINAFEAEFAHLGEHHQDVGSDTHCRL
jgi:hypothetical protein